MRREERLMEGIRVKGREGESNGESNRAIRRERGDTETEIGRERERGGREGGGRRHLQEVEVWQLEEGAGNSHTMNAYAAHAVTNFGP